MARGSSRPKAGRQSPVLLSSVTKKLKKEPNKKIASRAKQIAAQRENTPQNTKRPPPNAAKTHPQTRKTPQHFFRACARKLIRHAWKLIHFPAHVKRSTNTGYCRPAPKRPIRGFAAQIPFFAEKMFFGFKTPNVFSRIHTTINSPHAETKPPPPPWGNETETFPLWRWR